MTIPDDAPCTIRPAEWPRDEPAAIDLLRDYATFLGTNPNGPVEICLADYERELSGLAGHWSLPNGALLLAFLQNGPPAGCVAIKVRHDRPGSCEMKRLWVAADARGHRLGRRLAQAAIDWARQHGAGELLLDTVPAAMPGAAALYLSLGFVETARHNDNTVPGLQFMRLALR